ADRGERRWALALTDLAIVRHATGCHHRGIARSLVDRGMWLYYLGEPRQAIEAQQAALEQLPEDEQRNRFSALQNLGLCYQGLGETRQAWRCANLAVELVDGLGDWLRGKLLWLMAFLRLDEGEDQQAEELLREVIVLFKPIHPIESAVATTDLARLQLHNRRPADAYETARNAVYLSGALKKNRIAAAAIEDLCRYGYAGRGLTVEVIDGIARTIRKGWERQKRRSRRKR
ncbi:MAG: tetratricopeptide repeat protein, partial [bacterium]|nr:tetratricopeptide repeat protein [bacterium]